MKKKPRKGNEHKSRPSQQTAIVPRRNGIATKDAQNVARHANPGTPERTQTVLLREEHYQGPVLHPRLAEGWEGVVPGSADRILMMAENQAAHRQWIEKWAVVPRALSQPIGALIGGALVLLALYFGYALLMADKDVSGFGVIFSGLAPLIWAFRRATKGRDK